MKLPYFSEKSKTVWFSDTGSLSACHSPDNPNNFYMYHSEENHTVAIVEVSEEVALQMQLAAYRQSRYVSPAELGLDVLTYLL